LKTRPLISVLSAFAMIATVSAASGRADAAPQLALESGWHLQSSSEVHELGEKLSQPGFRPSGWYPVSVPTTVFAALVAHKVYPNPDFGMNLRSAPGVSYPIGGNFSNLPMPDDNPFRIPWWYQKSFRLPSGYRGKQVWLHFDGINYRATIWLNGHEIAGPDKVVGMWRLYEFNVTPFIHPGAENALAIEVSAPHADDLGITWVDWNPMPPDKEMGLWRPVYFTASGPVEIRHPQVETNFDLPSLAVAHLTVRAELVNATDHPVEGTLKGKIEDVEFSRPLTLEAHETRVVTFAPNDYTQLNFSQPKLWWPWEMGPQNLHKLDLSFEAGRAVSDNISTDFGIREITSEINEHGYRQFQVNGKNILIRGGGWSMDMLLRTDPKRLEWEIRYVKGMNLNTIRLEGKLDTNDFFNLCDRYGILVLAGWCCCDHWERWKTWKPEDYMVAADSLRDQVLRLRDHPCVLDWLYGSDNPPPPKVERMYLKVLQEYNWPNPHQSSATARPTIVTGPSGVKMAGPYEWVPPNYWLLDKRLGGAHGFATEISPGPAVPPLASLKEMLPADHLWPIDEFWNYHAGGGEFKDIHVYTEALDARYGKAASVEDYAEKSQVAAYDGERAMFEAYGRNKYVSTGVIQWMMNNGWPSIIWHLFDFYLRPGGGYFGAQKACEPLHIQYSYDDRSIVVVNSLEQAFRGLEAEAAVYDLDLTQKYSHQATVSVGPDGVERAFVLPKLDGLSTTYFVRLTLKDNGGNVRSRNFYWLSTKPDVLDWDHSRWYYTPESSFADLTGLKSLPEVSVKADATTEAQGDEDTTHMMIQNPSSHLAFFVHLRVTKGKDGKEVLPVLWQDNYFELMPGEKRELTATYSKSDLGGAAPFVAVDGWNIAAASTPAGK
jgi:exo-1,4-beta-D-glucosaminidase